MSFLRRDKTKSHLSIKDLAAGQPFSSGHVGSVADKIRDRAGGSAGSNERAAQKARAESGGDSDKLAAGLAPGGSAGSAELLGERKPLRKASTSQALGPNGAAATGQGDNASSVAEFNFRSVAKPGISRAQTAVSSPASPTSEFSARPPLDGYSPRLSYGLLPSVNEMEPAKAASKDETKKEAKQEAKTANKEQSPVLKDDYRGFHRPRSAHTSVPPLAQPIKPRFRKKGNALLGKLMHSSRKDSDTLLSTADGIVPQHTGGSTASPAAGNGVNAANGAISGTSANGVASVNGVNGTSADTPQGGATAGDAQASRKSVSSGGSKHKFRLPSISLHHHNGVPADSPRHLSMLEESRSEQLLGPASQRNSVSGPAHSPQKFDLDLDFAELETIVKRPLARALRAGSTEALGHREAPGDDSQRDPQRDSQRDSQKNSAWKAPDSWDVTALGIYAPTASAPVSGLDESDTGSISDLHEENGLSRNPSLASVASRKGAEGLDDPFGTDPRKHKRKAEHLPSFPEKSYPILYGNVATRTPLDGAKAAKGPNHIVRVFKSDNTFTTILCPLETTATELLIIIQRKFFLEGISNFQLSLYVGNNVKLLEPFEKPLRIQMGLLTLSGYKEKDNLSLLGREDLSSVCKIVVENMALRNLTHEEEASLSKDYINVDISGRDLKTIPIKFHQHTYEIEKLNVSNNPLIYIPLDFIQSCSNLTHIKFSRNGSSKFPLNFLEATGLSGLVMDCNFLDEIPARISHLKHLENLRLNSNQLYFLPKTFGKLSHLVTLNLSSNYFQKFPESITELENLQDLDLSYNDLAKIPDSIGKLVKLVKLNLSTNKLSKALPKGMSKLVDLKRLDIRYNKISNIDVLGALPSLEVMYASKNYISSFGDKMERLRLLHLDRNPITSMESDIVLQMLTVLDLSKAKIAALPTEFVSKIPHVEKLVLDKNYLVTLPEEMGNLPKLTHLSLFGNNIQNIPSSIGKLTSLQYLDLHSNNIDSIPAEIWKLSRLTYLNVSSNILSIFPKPVVVESSAPIPSIYDTSSDSRIAAQEPKGKPEKCLSDSLTVLQIADNSLNEESFEAIARLTSLKVLNVSYNDFSEIPEGALSNLRYLTELYLSGNSLTKLPAEDLENLSDLTRLFANGNKLQTLPSELSKCQKLTHLDVGSNILRYNISNWPYDWNWSYNKRLRYLNFSGNRRFEIKQSYTINEETNEPLDSLLVLKDLKVIGLMDVTLTTPRVPDQSVNVRLRTSSSELDDIGYGVSDAMGNADAIAFRDSFIQKFRGNENEVLILSCDGVGISSRGQGHLISYLTKQLFIPHFTTELEKISSNDEIPDAMRRAFLSLNKEVNSVFANKKFNAFTPSTTLPELNDLNLAEDGNKGSCISVVYIKDGIVYSANLGDMEIVLSKSNSDYKLLSTKHDPTLRKEFERIRAAGGYVYGDGALDGSLHVSRGVGFYNYVPHTHSGPSISIYNSNGADAVIIMASKVLWDYVTYDLAVDLARQEKDDPMLAAEKLRDHAICYGATDKISVTVISLGDQKRRRQKIASTYMNLSRESEMYTGKRRRDRGGASGDTALRRLNDEIEPPVGKLALVFTDIKNSTLLWDTYPVAMQLAIKLHNIMMRRQLRIVGGYEVKTEGDSFMVSFPTPTSALLWCFNVQNQLMNEDWPNEILETNEGCEVTDSAGNMLFRGLSVRMGIHWGSPVCELDMVTRRMDYFGPMVNRAARIESSADGGQIAVSSDFLREMERLYHLHEQISTGSVTTEAAYGGNAGAGEIIEREITSIEDIGCEYIELGERKLKGLETPENIVLAYPKNLVKRYELFKKRTSKSSEPSGRAIGTLPEDSVLALRLVSLRLEHICSVLNQGFERSNGKYKSFGGDIYANVIKDQHQDGELAALFNHLVTRVEHCVASLELRQLYQAMRGSEGPIDFTEDVDIWTILDVIKGLMDQAGPQRGKPVDS